MKEQHSAWDYVPAYHEAGHTVMAIVLGVSIDLVAIKEHAVTYHGDTDQFEHEIMISMAGDIAVRHFIDPKRNTLSGGDRRNIQKALNRKGIRGAERKQLRVQLRDRAERLLISENSAKVEKLAKALLKRPVLFIDQIQQILPEAHPSKDWPPRTPEERRKLYDPHCSVAFIQWLERLIPLREFRDEEGKPVKHRFEVNLYDDHGVKLRTLMTTDDFVVSYDALHEFEEPDKKHVRVFDCECDEYYEWDEDVHQTLKVVKKSWERADF